MAAVSHGEIPNNHDATMGKGWKRMKRKTLIFNEESENREREREKDREGERQRGSNTQPINVLQFASPFNLFR